MTEERRAQREGARVQELSSLPSMGPRSRVIPAVGVYLSDWNGKKWQEKASIIEEKKGGNV